jgi:hypothetical protein
MKHILALALALTSATVLAQTTGRLDSLKGNVSVVTDGVVSNAKNQDVLKNGSTILVASGGSATLVLNGCTVTLTERQSLKVDTALPCAELKLAATTLPRSSVVGAVGSFAAISAVGLTLARDDKPVSGF